MAGCPPPCTPTSHYSLPGGSDQVCFSLQFLAGAEAPHSCTTRGAWHPVPRQRVQSQCVLASCQAERGECPLEELPAGTSQETC